MLMQSRSIKSVIHLFLAYLCIFACFNAFASDYNFQFHGFLAQGFIKTSANDFLGDSSEGSFDFGEAVVNGRYSVSDDWYLAAQLISRDYGDYHVVEQDIDLDYGLLGGKIFSDSNQQLDFQIGMVKLPFGLLNIGRDIPSTHLGILLPQHIYNEYNRNKNLSNYGGLLQYNITNDWGDIQASLAIGKINMSEKEHKEIFATSAGISVDMLNNFSHDTDVNKTVQVIYSTPDKHLRFGFTFNEDQYDYRVSSLNSSQEVIVKYSNYIYSLEYQIKDWSFLAEIYRRNQSTSIDLQFNNSHIQYTNKAPNTEFKYLQASYAINDQVELFTRYEHGYLDTHNKYNYSPFGQSSSLGYHKNWVNGLDWYINDSLLFKAEYHRVKGCASLHWSNNDYSDLKDDWSMLMLQLVYHF